MTSLTQGLIETWLSDNRYLTAFPEFVEGKRRLINVTNVGKAKGSCCADYDAQTSATATRAALGWIKRTIALMPPAKQTQLLKMAGFKALQVSYNDAAAGSLKTVVLEPTA